jgi:hypothetical protein
VTAVGVTVDGKGPGIDCGCKRGTSVWCLLGAIVGVVTVAGGMTVVGVVTVVGAIADGNGSGLGCGCKRGASVRCLQVNVDCV